MTRHVVVACDKFKGSLTAAEVNRQVERGLRDVVPGVAVRTAAVADGGDGTLRAVASAGFALVPVTVSGPTGHPVGAHYAVRDGVVVVELADACGLGRLPGGALRPLTASSRGLGELVAAALETAPKRVVIGLGGSASTDGGAGMLTALGARFRDHAGADLPDGGAALTRLAHVDLAGIDPRLASTEVVVACDVDSPLLGRRGAVEVFAAQKGADRLDRGQLERGLARFSTLVDAAVGRRVAAAPGSGAAGGVGYAALAVLGARMTPGVDLVLDTVGFPALLDGARLVVTGEGSLDTQTLTGKAPAGVARAAARAGVPVVAVCGRSDLDRAALDRLGVRQAFRLTDREPDVGRCLANAADLLRLTANDLALRWL